MTAILLEHEGEMLPDEFGTRNAALTRGYHLAFAIGALFAAAAGAIAWLLLRESPQRRESWATP